jgi:hypothetical protein
MHGGYDLTNEADGGGTWAQNLAPRGSSGTGVGQEAKGGGEGVLHALSE